MSSWPPGTRNRLLFVLSVGLGVALVLWFGLVSPLQVRLKTAVRKADMARMQLKLAETGVDKGPYYRQLAEEKRQEIAELESNMAKIALFNWQWGTLLPYEKVYGIIFRGWEVPRLGTLDVPPEVPYSMASFTVTGQGYFHDFGTFLAAFENSSPFIKLTSLRLQALTPGFGSMDDPEQLSFRMDTRF